MITKKKSVFFAGCGKKEVTFKSVDAANPAKFYINSTPAYKEHIVVSHSIR